eukprot:1187557-Prorocentrum_minimum.AAC.2
MAAGFPRNPSCPSGKPDHPPAVVVTVVRAVPGGHTRDPPSPPSLCPLRACTQATITTLDQLLITNILSCTVAAHIPSEATAAKYYSVPQAKGLRGVECTLAVIGTGGLVKRRNTKYCSGIPQRARRVLGRRRGGAPDGGDLPLEHRLGPAGHLNEGALFEPALLHKAPGNLGRTATEHGAVRSQDDRKQAGVSNRASALNRGRFPRRPEASGGFESEGGSYDNQKRAGVSNRASALNRGRLEALSESAPAPSR